MISLPVHAQALLCANGPNVPGLLTGSTSNSGVAAPVGTQWSEVQNNTGNTTESNTLSGTACSRTATLFRCADDFMVPTGGWTLSGVATLAYQTGFTGTVSPITGMNVQVFGPCADGLIPGDVGCSLIAGDTTTNILAASTDIGGFRIFNSLVPAPVDVPATNRRIWRNEAAFSPSISLTTPGRYWMDFQTVIGTNAAHFAPAITIRGLRGVPGWNAVQFTGAGYVPVLDVGNPTYAPDVPLDFPFEMLGTGTQRPVGEGCVPSALLFADGFDDSPPLAHMDYFGTGATSFGTLSFPAAGGAVTWNIRSNGSMAAPISVPFGLTSSASVGDGDFDGDGKADIAIYDSAVGVKSFRYLPSSTGGPEVVVPWGDNTTDNVTATGDYDCDGKTDPTYVRDVAGAWQWGIKTSGPGPDRLVNFGNSATDVLLFGMDWNGDGCDDLGTARIAANSDITFRIGNASTGALLLQQVWGDFDTDFIVPGDFIGDESADFAVWRGFGAGTSGEWMIKENGGPGMLTQVLGVGGSGGTRDTPLRGDFDGDGKDDLAVKKVGTATWQWRRSSDGVIDQTTVGLPADLALPQFGVQ